MLCASRAANTSLHAFICIAFQALLTEKFDIHAGMCNFEASLIALKFTVKEFAGKRKKISSCVEEVE